jgi:hypothetical protein
MRLIDQSEYSSLRSELNEYAVLCNAYNYTPKRSEFDDIIRFILLLNNDSAGGSRLCESYELNPFPILDHLYESFGFDENYHEDFEIVIEAGEGQVPYDPEKDTESATGLVIAGGAAAVAGAAALTVGVGKWIQYLMKKGKVKKSVDAEFAAEMKKLQSGYLEIAADKKKLAALTGEEQKMDWPGMAPGGGDSGKEEK